MVDFEDFLDSGFCCDRNRARNTGNFGHRLVDFIFKVITLVRVVSVSIFSEPGGLPGAFPAPKPLALGRGQIALASLSAEIENPL